MKSISLVLCSTIALLVLAACTTAAPEPAADTAPRYGIMTHREDDIVSVQSEPNRVTFDIISPVGISAVVIDTEIGSFPAEVVLDLHLSGLEELTVMYANVAVQASVSSIAPHEIRQTVRIAQGEPQDITEDSPYWLDITIVGAESPSIPLTDGYFEVVLPDDFTQGAYDAFSAEWVDFYR